MTMEADAKQTYLQAARALELPGRQAWIKALRQRGAQRFDAVGFPTTRDEAWKYTNLAALTRQRFNPTAAASLTAQQLERLLPDTFDASRLVFVDGRYRPELSTPPVAQDRAIAGSLAAALTSD